MSEKIIIYKSKDGLTKIDVKLEDNTLWLTQAQIAELFERDISVISRHIKNILGEGELDKKSNLHFLQIPNSDKSVAFYSLDMIIAIGYRVKSPRTIRCLTYMQQAQIITQGLKSQGDKGTVCVKTKQ